LYLITSFDYGGAQKNLFEIVCRASARGFNVAVASIKDGGIYEKKFKDAGILVRTLGVLSEGGSGFVKVLLSPFLYIRAFVRLLILAEDISADIIHSFLFQANILGRIAAKFLNIKNISSIRVIEKEKKWQNLISRFTGFMTDTVTVNSPQLYEFVAQNKGVPPDKIILINNYIDVKNLPRKDISFRRKFKLSPTDFVVVSAGRLERQKGFEYLIEAAGLIKEEIPSLRVVIAGDGVRYNFLQNLITELNLESVVNLIGVRNDVADLIAASDVFVLPSLWEGFPNVILESIAIGVPVIATDSSCVESFVEEDFIVKSADAVALAQKILDVFKNRIPAYVSVEKSSEKLATYSSEKIFEKYFDIYEKITG